MPHQLDCSRPFGTISGRPTDAPNARYEQDGRYFDGSGQEVSKVHRPASHAIPPAPNSISSAAERMQRFAILADNGRASDAGENEQ